MCGDRVDGVAAVFGIFHLEYFVAGNLVPLEPSQQLGTLPREHGPADQLNMSSQLSVHRSHLVVGLDIAEQRGMGITGFYAAVWCLHLTVLNNYIIKSYDIPAQYI